LHASGGPPRTRRQWLLLGSAALACAGALSIPGWIHKPNWANADSLFYQAMTLEVRGASPRAAQREVFGTTLARPAIVQEHNVAQPRWQSFERRFFRRRWLVPALAAAIQPVAGMRALPDAAIVGYMLFGVALCLLLASQFGVVPSLAASILCLALAPTRDWGLRPMTDSWGLALTVAAIGFALLTLARGYRWLLPWIVAMIALSFTRDLAPIPLAALAWLTLAYRRDARLRRPALLLLACGVLVTIPPYLLFGASLRLTLASIMAGFEVPTHAHATWGYVAAHYPSLMYETIKFNLHYVISNPTVGLTVGLGLIALFAVPARGERLVLAMRGATLGWLVVFVLDPVVTGFRYELGLLPPAAAGLCALVGYLGDRYASRRGSPTRTEAAVAAGSSG
jgi:hypothetical protein